MASPAGTAKPEDLDDLDEPAPEGDEPEREDSGLDVELEPFDTPEPTEIDAPIELEGEPLDELDDDGSDEGAPIQLPDEAVELLELPDAGADEPLQASVQSGFDAEGELLGDERSIDDGGEEGLDDEEDELDELADLQIEPDGPDGLDVSSSEALPPWADVVATRADAASFDLRFDPNPAPTRRHELAVGSDADGTRLSVVDDEEGAKFFRGDVLVSDLVPELPLSGIAMLGERPIYWVEGEGLFDEQVYIPGTQGLCALAAAPNGLVLALSARGEHVLALWREGAMPERIADLHGAPEQLQVRGATIAVSGAAGLEVFTLPVA